MSTNRRRIARPSRTAITGEMVALFQRGVEIQRQGKHEGECKSEFIDVCNALHRMLGRRPWHDDILDLTRQPDDDSGRWARLRLEASVPEDDLRDAARVAQEALWRENWEYANSMPSEAARLAQIKHYDIPEELVRRWDAERGKVVKLQPCS
jgi:hypothetical protein